MEGRDATDAVVMDEVGVRRLAGPRGPESVDWLDLRAVRIRRTVGARGPQDVEFVFHGAGSVCTVPLRLAPEELILRLQQLPGFDNASLIEALSTPGAADFVCWRPRETALLTRSA